MSLPNLQKPRHFASVVTCLLLTGAVVAQSPPPFAWIDTAAPDTLGPPLGFGDVEGDGSPDLVVIAYGGVPAVLRNDGHGRFTATTSFIGDGGTPVGAIADFNLDGRADVAVVGTGNAGFVSVYFGSPAGVLTFGYTLPVPDAATVAAGDVNGDGAPDLVFGAIHFNTPPCGQVCAFVSASVVMLNANDGTGNLTAVGTLGLPGLGRAALVLCDIDLDGDQDLLTFSQGTGGVVFNVGGTFGAAVNVSAAGSLTNTIVIARFNNDAYPDALGSSSGPPVLMLGGPAGLTQYGPGPVVNGFAASVAVDLNGDGIDEVVEPTSAALEAYSVGAGGVLNPLLTLPRVGGPILVRDVDGDGDGDLMVHENVTHANTLYFADGAGGLHEQGPPCQPRYMVGGPVPLDVNGDGVPDLVGIAQEGAALKLAIATNDGVGRFTWSSVAPGGLPLLGGQTLMAAADLDADGDKDLVVVEMANAGSNWAFKIRGITNGGNGSWTAGGWAQFSTGMLCDMVVADMNGDGTEDIVFGDTVNGVQIIYAYGGVPSMPGAPISPLPASRLALADMDGDGDLDVVVANLPSSRLLVNQGGGVFSVDPAFPFQGATFCTVGDVTGDGIPDCYLNNHLFLHSGANWIHYGDIPTGLILGGQAAEVRSFDFDGDGDIDTITGAGLAYVNEGGTVTTYNVPMSIGQGQHLTPIDLDRDGDLDLLCVPAILSLNNYPGGTTAMSVLFNTARQLTIEAPARPGHLTHMGIRGAPGGLWFLFASTGLASIAAPPFGTILIDPLPALQIGAGTLDSAGTADWSVLLPPSFSIYVGAEFDDQAFVDTVAGPRITNARRVVISAY